METPALSIVCPVRNEAAALEELIRRIDQSAKKTGLAFEILLIDDASTDESQTFFSELARRFDFRVVRLSERHGQFRATQAGLREARGDWVIVLDGDLQDPPEVIAELVAAQRKDKRSVPLILALKRSRAESSPFRAAAAMHHTLLCTFSRNKLPTTAGSYCLMSRELAKRVASVPLDTCNLSAIFCLLEPRFASVAYEKAARYDKRSRVGWRGLIAESLFSLWIAGALAPLLFALAGLASAVGLSLLLFSCCTSRLCGALLLFCGAVLALLALFAALRQRRLKRKIH